MGPRLDGIAKRHRAGVASSLSDQAQKRRRIAAPSAAGAGKAISSRRPRQTPQRKEQHLRSDPPVATAGKLKDCGSLSLRTPEGWHLPNVVCSYGFCMLAPVLWEPVQGRGKGGVLYRPLRLLSGSVLHAEFRQRGRRLCISFRCRLPEVAACRRRLRHVAELDHLRQQVQRMLRLSPLDATVVAGFHALHPRARREGFGRLFRSPSLWEDIVKTVLLCNCGWTRSLTMAERLCSLVGADGDCPTPSELAAAPLASLRRAGLGYRAGRLRKLAAAAVACNLRPEEMCGSERPLAALRRMAAASPGAPSTASAFSAGASQAGLRGEAAELYRAARALHGFGDFAARNLLQLCGEYSAVAADSETARHLRACRGVPTEKLATAAAVGAAAQRAYRRYGRFRQLAYWWELWRGYEALHGPVERMRREDYAKCCRTPVT